MPGWDRDDVRRSPTWIWSVAVDGALYVRGYSGQDSRWYRAAAQHIDAARDLKRIHSHICSVAYSLHERSDNVAVAGWVAAG